MDLAEPVLPTPTMYSPPERAGEATRIRGGNGGTYDGRSDRRPYSPGPVNPSVTTVQRFATVERRMHEAKAVHGFVPKRGKWSTTRFAADKLAKLDLARERALAPEPLATPDLDELVADMVANPSKYLSK